MSLGRILIALLLGAPFASRAEPVPAKDFARFAQYDEVEISPNGEYLAVRAPLGQTKTLAVLRLSDLKVMTAINPEDGEQVAGFAWVGPDRLMYSQAQSNGFLAQPYLTGELFAINADGKQAQYLYGYRGKTQGRLTTTLAYGQASLFSSFRDDPKRALISVRAFDASERTPERIDQIDVYTGQRAEVTRAPAPGGASFAADAQGQVRYVSVTDPESRIFTRSWWRAPDERDWREEPVFAGKPTRSSPLNFSADGKAIYLSSTEGGDKTCLVRRDFDEAATRTVLACDDNGDLVEVLYASDGHTPLAVVFAAGRPEIRWLETEHPERRILQRLSASFGGDWAEPVSATRDGSKLVLFVSGDRNPGDYYLYDRATDKAQYLISQRTWIDPEQMAEQRVVSFKARDGHPLWAYLTLPSRRKQDDKLPLIVYPHGGPFFARDHWGWDSDAQFLASRGYAVLQVNFRGSEGYGNQHALSAKRGWGTLMIDDITDAARQVIEQGLADGSRVCIYGASYGGYAALMSAVREPELYRCAVSYVGIFDMALFQRDTDVSRSRSGARYLDDWVAGTQEEILKHSPSTYIERLKAPLMIIHGESDRRVPFTQAQSLRKVLDARKHPYVWLTKANEGHGFYDEANRTEVYEKLLAFFDQNIGATATAVAPPPE
ncbi:MAG: alpha/beta hydrolase family protein [Panacagrimonas sp.]